MLEKRLEDVLYRFQEETKKNCVSMEIEEGKPDIEDTKLGGLPCLPRRESYPHDHLGREMPLLIQINFSQFHLENYPEKGLLQIYMGRELNYPTDYKIRYYEDVPLLRNDQLQEITELEYFVVQREYRLRLYETQTYMSLGDYRFEQTFSEIFNDRYGTNISSIWDIDTILRDKNASEEFLAALKIQPGLIGGYADFTQEDPRNQMQNPPKECLVKIDSQMDEKKIHIGDAGIISVVISEEDIKKRNFTKAKLEWDCL